MCYQEVLLKEQSLLKHVLQCKSSYALFFLLLYNNYQKLSSLTLKNKAPANKENYA